ncbi:MAG: FixH family protein [Gammaproteobacteria bacterium]|nr:FixH family protein [Gammaproteobacteria bacterium]MBU1647144.1 FixH family protein [Gammaproteobacteria bacterium]MBU1972656.1 FixH family protein [Gammaproteobacteria bacterium]
MSKTIKNPSGKDTQPWYREPWPWLIMLGPFIVVIAGIVTAWLAVSTSDGLVSDDYYKKGLKVDQTVASSARASALGLTAGVRLTADTLSLRLAARSPDFVLPDRLVVTVSHPTRAGLDQTKTLSREGAVYTTGFRLPASGHWLVSIEDETGNWRLLGKIILPASGEVLIGDPSSENAPAR